MSMSIYKYVSWLQGGIQDKRVCKYDKQCQISCCRFVHSNLNSESVVNTAKYCLGGTRETCDSKDCGYNHKFEFTNETYQRKRERERESGEIINDDIKITSLRRKLDSAKDTIDYLEQQITEYRKMNDQLIIEKAKHDKIMLDLFLSNMKNK